jgi:D-glycero-alpha-D-manno-heptose-7-phosphate kinase
VTDYPLIAPARSDARATEGRHAVRARAPLRLGLAGGGTDLSPYCDTYGGAILNVTIDRYAHAFVGPATDGVKLHAADLAVRESFAQHDALDDGRLRLHRAVHKRFMNDLFDGEWFNLSVTTSVDSPPGSGLGSSSALVVALVEAYRSYFDVPMDPYQVARLAFEIERIDLGLAGGRQDQYAAAFGGVNFIEFLSDDRVVVNPLRVGQNVLDELETSLVICFSGQSRESSNIIESQQEGMRSADNKTIDALHTLKEDAIAMKAALLSGRLGTMAEILNRSWEAKKRTAPGIQTGVIGELQAIGEAAGARASKVSGAGGGGFVMFLVPPEDRQCLIQALNTTGSRASSVKFTQNGAESWRRLANSL